MKLLLLNTAQGLKPVCDSDFEENRKLKIGEVYSAVINRPRNPKFHRKYFALINCAYDNLPESISDKYPTSEIFRKAVEVMAGHCELSYSLDGEQILIPKSISFSSIDESEFQKIYNGILDILLKHVFAGVDRSEIESQLINFY